MMSIYADELCTRFFHESDLDYIGFWEILAAVKQLDVDASKEEQKNEVMSIVKCLLQKKLVAFSFDNGSNNLNIWKEASVEMIMHRIKQEWDKLPGEIGLGDVCWFTKCINYNG